MSTTAYGALRAGCLVLLMVALLMVPASTTALPTRASDPEPGHAVVPTGPALTSPVRVEASAPSAIGTSHAVVDRSGPRTTTGINPISIYPGEPAPMGISDMGVGAAGVPYSYSTTQILTNVSWTAQDIYNDSLPKAARDLYSFQLNAFVSFVDKGTTYYYWIQDVGTMDTTTRVLQFMDCVWNATTASAVMTNKGTVTGNGSVSGGVYSWDSSTAPGATVTTTPAASFEMIIQSATNAKGEPVVYLGYQDSATPGYYQDFDTVTFVWANAVTADNNFVVNGNSYNSWGTAYDAEIMVGGPYNGYFTVAHATTDMNFQIYRWNGHNFESPPSTWNFGSETAESISNAQTFFSNDGDGTPEDTVWNGTAHNATTGALYDQYQVGVLSVQAPSIPSGTIAVAGDRTPFSGGQAYLVLDPGVYHVWVNSSLGSNDLGMCTIIAATNLSVSVPGSCAVPTITSFTLSPNPVTVGNPETFTVTATGGTGALTYSYGGLPAGCASKNLDPLVCSPTVAGTYDVYANVTDTASHTASASNTLTVVPPVPPPLAITSFKANPQNVSQAWSTTLSVTTTGGTAPLSYVYTNLPPGCATMDLNALYCTPTASGWYNATVEVADSSVPTQHAWANATLYVEPAPPPLVITSFTANPNPVVVDTPTTINVTTTGGDGWVAFIYTGLPSGCASIASQFTCSPTAVGTFTVQVNASIDTSSYAVMNLVLVVSPAAGNSPLALTSFVADPSSVALGGSSQLTAVGSGGAKPYTFLYWANGTGCSFADTGNNSCAPTATGTFQIVVVLTDAHGATVHGSTSLTVTSASSSGQGPVPSGTFFGLSTVDWLALVAVIAIGAVAIALVLRRKTPPPEPMAPWPPAPYEQP